MVDTNGRVAASHLRAFGSVQVSAVIYPRVVATAADFYNSHWSFNIQPPGGGDRPWDMQGGMQHDYDAGKYQQPPYYLSPPPSPRPGNPGTSRHGFALAIDVTSNAPVAVRDAILARNGWHLWSTSDRNHYEPNGINVLVSPPDSAFAGLGSTPFDNSAPTSPSMPQEATMFVVSSPAYRNAGQNVLAGEAFGAFPIPIAGGVASIIRRVVPAVDFDSENEMNAVISLCWSAYHAGVAGTAAGVGDVLKQMLVSQPGAPAMTPDQIVDAVKTAIGQMPAPTLELPDSIQLQIQGTATATPTTSK